MSIIDSYACVNYFMSVLVANIFFSKFDCRPRPLYMHAISTGVKGELTKKFLFLFSLDQVSLISLLKYFPPKMSLT